MSGRSRRSKVDSNEVLREFREHGWKPCMALDNDTADPRIISAVHACVRPRQAVETHAEQLCSFVCEHLNLATVSMVDIFSANLWDTALDPEWAAELLTLTDEEVALLSAGKLERAWLSPSLAAFVANAHKLDLPRECAVPQAASERRVPLVAMTEKKAHEVRVLAHVAAHLAYENSVRLVVDLGSGKGYLSDALALGYALRVMGIDSAASNTTSALSRHALVSRLMNLKRYGEMAQTHASAGERAAKGSGEPGSAESGKRRRKKSSGGPLCDAGPAGEEDAILVEREVAGCLPPERSRGSGREEDEEEVFITSGGEAADVVQESPRVHARAAAEEGICGAVKSSSEVEAGALEDADGRSGGRRVRPVNRVQAQAATPDGAAVFAHAPTPKPKSSMDTCGGEFVAVTARLELRQSGDFGSFLKSVGTEQGMNAEEDEVMVGAFWFWGKRIGSRSPLSS